jgi:hypothetical protein
MLRINKDKPIELMSYDNEWSIKNRVGRLHCMTSNLSVIRKLWNKRVKSASKELRRGWIKCVIETHQANQDLYIRVMNGLL